MANVERRARGDANVRCRNVRVSGGEGAEVEHQVMAREPRDESVGVNARFKLTRDFEIEIVVHAGRR